ncbi:MAG TPA: hypothetical protein VMZ30_21795, partial [Pyrinomonadaceae bacterium]|nr:hypothetical protein [Pyrinomonadaceae bacterium]
PDPWQILLELPLIQGNKNMTAICRASQSQLFGICRLSKIALGTATLHTDWHRDGIAAKADGDIVKSERAFGKVTDALASFEIVQDDIRSNAPAEVVREMEEHLRKEQRRLSDRGEAERGRPRSWPDINARASENPVEHMLVELWVRFPPVLRVRRRELNAAHHIPGLMFFRNEATAKFIRWVLQKNDSDLAPKNMEKIRQRLGLIQVGDSKCMIWDFEITEAADGSSNLRPTFRLEK